jgi:hypothetical protein
MPKKSTKSSRTPLDRNRTKPRSERTPARSRLIDKSEPKKHGSRRQDAPIRNHDPLYEKIIERLGRVSDGDKFEACVADLLRAEWPTLIPIPGGDDTGMDGAWSDEMGAGLVIATTGLDVIGNVTRNLEKHLAEGGTRRRVIVATTQTLTARRIRNIEERILTLGFSPAHSTYIRQALADRLYRNSRWLKELLGISGMSSALSRVPKRIRPLSDIPIVGRADDLEWLQSTKGDRLLIGQPGIGKTFLSQSLVNAGYGLFAVEDDIHRLLDGIRDQSPQAIIVEDAHLRLDTLEALCRSRIETGADFEIVADCWPNSAAEIRAKMGLTGTQCREINLVEGTDIIRIAKHAGIHGPNWLLHTIVRQSGGCPGRAALLAHVTLTSKDLREVAFGKTLTDWVHSTFRDVAGERGMRTLAAIALAGEHGISMERIGSVLGCSSSDMMQDLANLAHGGVVHQMSNKNLSVRPDVLRGSLVAQYFFNDRLLIPLEPVLSQLPNLDSVCGSLIGALECGAGVPTEMILQKLSRTHDQKLWERFAWTSAANARRVLELRPRFLVELAPAFLARIPEIVLPQLVKAAEGDERELHSHPSHPLRHIETWVRSAIPGSGEALARRELVLQTFITRIQSAADSSTAFSLLKTVVTTQFEVCEQTPGNPNSYSSTRGVVTDDELRGIGTLWTRILKVVLPLRELDWSVVLCAIDEWLSGGSPFATVSQQHHAIRRNTARMVIEALITHSDAGCGVRAALRSRAKFAKIKTLKSEPDVDFLVLFPEDNSERAVNRQAADQRNAKSVLRLVTKWKNLPPKELASRLVVYHRQKKYVTSWHNDYLRYFCQKLAETVESASHYVETFLEHSAGSELILPFLDQARVKNEKGWLELARKCFQTDCQRVAGLDVMLRSEIVLPEDFESACVAAARASISYVDFLVMTGRVPLHRVRRLLEDECLELAESVASAMWRVTDSPKIPDAIHGLWSRVISESSIEGFRLAEIFRANAQVAFLWLSHRVSRATRSGSSTDKAISAAASVINDEQRRQVLNGIDGRPRDGEEIVNAVISGKCDIYREYFEKLRIQNLHLAPLTGEPNSRWASMASVALEAGIDPSDIVDSAFRDQLFIRGSWADEQARRAGLWRELGKHSSLRIRQIAATGHEIATENVKRERKSEHDEMLGELYG